MRVLLGVLILFFSGVIYGQKMPSDYFAEASNFFEQEKFDEALNGYQYIIDNHPKNELYPRAFYNVGYIHFIQENYDKATTIFKSIIDSNFNEKEDLVGSIMADPYTNYRHRASTILSEIYYDKRMFDTSLKYFVLSDTIYPYLHFCGNEYAANDVYSALRYSDIYQKLNQNDKAIEKLLPAIFIRLADNSEVIEELKKLLLGKDNLRKQLESSLKNIYLKRTKGKE